VLQIVEFNPVVEPIKIDTATNIKPKAVVQLTPPQAIIFGPVAAASCLTVLGVLGLKEF